MIHILRQWPKAVLALILAVAISAPLQARSESDSLRGPVVIIKAPGASLDRRAYELYCNGLILERIGDLDAAAQNYKKAREFFPESQEIGLSLANAYLNNRNPDEALEVLKSILPRDAQVWEMLATCYRMKGDDKSALDAYRKVVSLDSTDAMAYSFLAGYFQMTGAIDSTIWAFNQLARCQPNNYRVWFEIGRLKALQKDLDGAKAAMRASLAIESGPENSNTLQALGEIFTAAQELDSAKELYKVGLERDRANIQLHNKIIGIYIQQDSMAQALPYARFVADANPLDRFALRRLGMIYFALDSIAPCEEVFAALEKAGDDSPTTYYYLGRTASLRKDNDRAIGYFRKLTIVADTAMTSWYSLGYAYRELGQRDKEIETYRAGIEHMRSEQGAVNLYFALGAAQEQAGQFDSSVATFEEMIKHSPDNAQALNYLGYMLADKGVRLDYAKQLLTRAISLEPESPAILDSYAWVHYRLGELDTALIYLNQAVKLDTDATIFDHLGDVYQAKGNLEQARHWWQRALDIQPENAEIRKKLVP